MLTLPGPMVVGENIAVKLGCVASITTESGGAAKALKLAVNNKTKTVDILTDECMTSFPFIMVILRIWTLLFITDKPILFNS